MNLRSRILATSLVALSLVALASGVAYTAPKAGDMVTVRVLRAKLMKKPGYIGAVADTVSRGAKLKVVEVKGLWYRVEGDGWIHKSSVMTGAKELSTQPGGGVGASNDEVELAGRGFTPQVEEKYRKDNPEFDFSHVDAIEKTELDPESLGEFVSAGGLGGAQ